jgi:prolyl-tRNA synthetase
LINQWANVVRWELRTRPFLRTTEFLWQEGHTAHANAQEAIEEAEKIHEIYTRFVEDYMAIPVIKGRKTASERFAGAIDTYTIEALMQDNKALQAGTSHFLGQNFAKAFDVKYLTDQNTNEYVWATSWGVSTRLVGGLIMTHSDDEGLVLPPRMAPLQVIIIPIPKPSPEISTVSHQIMTVLKAKGISVSYDQDERNRPGFKFAENEMRGIPVRIGIGQRDLAQNQVEIARRDTKEKKMIPLEGVAQYVEDLLQSMQSDLFEQAKRFRDNNSYYIDTYEDFKKKIEDIGGFFYCHWDGTAETEAKIKEETKATIRCIPIDQPVEDGKCMVTGAPSKGRVIIARAY